MRALKECANTVCVCLRERERDSGELIKVKVHVYVWTEQHNRVRADVTRRLRQMMQPTRSAIREINNPTAINCYWLPPCSTHRCRKPAESGDGKQVCHLSLLGTISKYLDKRVPLSLPKELLSCSKTTRQLFTVCVAQPLSKQVILKLPPATTSA